MGKKISGVAVSDGIVIGKAKKFSRQTAEIPQRTLLPGEEEAERMRFDHAVEECGAHLEQIIGSVVKDERADILRAHLNILRDPFLRDKTMENIRNGNNVEYALASAVIEISKMFLELDDETLRARAADFQDVSTRIHNQLLGVIDEDISSLFEPVIVIAKELLPSDTATMDTRNILGFATEQGGRTSHTAIMARGLAIPAIVGTGECLYDSVADGDILILDGTAGIVCILPTEDELFEYESKQSEFAELLHELEAFRNRPAVTLDGRKVKIMSNIGMEKEVLAAVLNGAEGIGLLRTEFLYMDRDCWPTEDEQFASYKYAVQQMKGCPVVIRTLDIGGDKNLPYYEFTYEENPCLGNRAIRFCLNNTDIFRVQLRAILRASAYGKILVMLPMVISLEEIIRSKALISECMAQLEREGKDFDSELQIGIMIETPAAVLQAEILAKKVDFFSIGTNDLTQYILAVDRGNQKIQQIYNPFHPAVLSAIRQVIDAGNKAGIWVGMCGEFASNPLAAPLLLGMGLDELSVSPASIPRLKKAICSVNFSHVKAFADKVLKAETTEEVLRFLERSGTFLA